jgi:hypothetical protein
MIKHKNLSRIWMQWTQCPMNKLKRLFVKIQRMFERPLACTEDEAQESSLEQQQQTFICPSKQSKHSRLKHAYASRRI